MQLALVVSIYAEAEGRSTPAYSQPESVAEHHAAGRSVLGSKLGVQTPSGRSVEVFLPTQRVGGYVFWIKRRFQPAGNRFVAIILVSSTEWRNAIASLHRP